MIDDAVAQPRIQDRLRLRIPRAGLGDIEADQRHLLRDPAGRADLQPPAGQVIEHPDLFNHAPWLVIRQHDAHHA